MHNRFTPSYKSKLQGITTIILKSAENKAADQECHTSSSIITDNFLNVKLWSA